MKKGYRINIIKIMCFQHNNMIANKCEVLIPYQLSEVQLADKVLTFNSGHMAECSIHKMFYIKEENHSEISDKQAKFYRESTLEGKQQYDY